MMVPLGLCIMCTCTSVLINCANRNLPQHIPRLESDFLYSGALQLIDLRGNELTENSGLRIPFP